MSATHIHKTHSKVTRGQVHATTSILIEYHWSPLGKILAYWQYDTNTFTQFEWCRNEMPESIIKFFIFIRFYSFSFVRLVFSSLKNIFRPKALTFFVITRKEARCCNWMTFHFGQESAFVKRKMEWMSSWRPFSLNCVSKTKILYTKF